ncbi:hypothetical protein Hypma_003786 [Hypsizygus marmoreus]|uniref:Uncharacterized protein n=1 Tax=Hypsizygus marmoreus TaxID=39966 RepID=A0A369K0R2_HYPMA|nr:hypothetical protein Hypma_003786 [Hypsizygus marmoreus]
MKRPNAVGDLQKGERYCNMDYLFYKSLVNSELKEIYVSYDICCQWSINLQQRMFALDHEFYLFNGEVFVKFLVPKFHLPAHVAACRTTYSFNFMRLASTKEMGPGSRRDALDAHFGDYNWRKVVGPTLLRKLKAATTDLADHVIAHGELDESLPLSTPNSSSCTPYHGGEDARKLAAGQDLALDVNVTPSVLIATGLDLEAEHASLVHHLVHHSCIAWCIARASPGAPLMHYSCSYFRDTDRCLVRRSVKMESSKLWLHAQDRQKTKLTLRNNALSRKIVTWTQHQQLYIPSVVVLRRMDAHTAQARTTVAPVHEYPLWLPSQIGVQVPFDVRLAEIEWKLRLAQAEEVSMGFDETSRFGRTV